MKNLIYIIAISLLLSACIFDKKIDASSEQAMQTSIRAVMSGLNEQDQERFQRSLRVIMFDGVGSLMDLALMGQNMEATKGAFLAKVDGKTAKEIIAMAEAKDKKREPDKPKEITSESLISEVKDDALNQAVSAKLIKKTNIKGDYREGVSFTIAFTNKTEKEIKGIKGVLIFNDIFGDLITRVSISMDENIKPLTEIKYDGGVDINRFQDEDIKLKNTPLNKIEFVFKPNTIIFVDGSRLSLSQ